MGQPYPYPGQQGQPPKKGNGCWIALAIVGGLLLLMGAAGAFVCMKIVKKTEQIAQAGLNAPGTKELEKLGCRPGMVMDIEAAAGLIGMADAAAAAVHDKSAARYIVSCTVPSSVTAPSCEDVKGEFMSAVPSPGGRFMTEVQMQGQPRPTCKKLFEANGTFLHDLP